MAHPEGSERTPRDALDLCENQLRHRDTETQSNSSRKKSEVEKSKVENRKKERRSSFSCFRLSTLNFRLFTTLDFRPLRQSHLAPCGRQARGPLPGSRRRAVKRGAHIQRLQTHGCEPCHDERTRSRRLFTRIGR